VDAGSAACPGFPTMVGAGRFGGGLAGSSFEQQRQALQVTSEKAVLAAVRLPESRFDPQDPFGELRELARQAGAEVVGELTQNLDRPVVGTYIGTGKLEELRGLCELTGASTVIFDHELSPKQIAGIEKIVERKVLDRSELILDIFAGRATTREAQLQVELAQLEYTYPRLRAMWTHLERVTGGSPQGVGTRGPGEQQLEIDRRLVQRKKTQLQRELDEIQGRKSRSVRQRRLDHCTVGLVGYTNAGKSTLFNTLTAGGAYADDRVFATLMTRTRQWDLGGGLDVMLSDTVGFVRELPHHLVASFRATLEEATHADLLLVVLDVADPAAELHLETVHKTLDELFDDRDRREPGLARPERVLLLNKADRLADNRELLVWQQRVPGAIPMCALPGDDGSPRLGGETLTDRVRTVARGEIRERELVVPMRDSKTVSAIENRAEVVERAYEGESVRFRVRIGDRQLAQLRAGGGTVEVVGDPGAGHTPRRRGWAASAEDRA